MSERLHETRRVVEEALIGLSDYFHPDCKLTFVMRKPDNAECYMVVTNDDPNALATLLSEQEGK